MISTIAVTVMLAMADPPSARPRIPPPPIVRTVPPPILYAPPPPPAPPAPAPPPPSRYSERARAKVNLGSLIGEDDYPAVANRNREEGVTGFRLVVGPNGRVSHCSILQSSGSVSLDSATCRLLTSRARFTPARDSAGAPATDSLRGRIVWRLVNDIDRPWAPALFVEEMRSTAAGAVTCWQGWPPEELLDETCPAGEAVRLAARARASGKPLERSIVTWLTPEGMAEIADRPGRGTLFLSAEAIFTIGADGKTLSCRALRSQYVGRDRPPGLPPGPCIGWDIGNNLYLPAAEAGGTRTVNVKVRGYVGPAPAPAAPVTP